VAAVALALIYLILAAARSIVCWAAAGISSILYIKICYDAHLLIETGLQFFYLLMAVVGYFDWKKNSTQQVTDVTLLSSRSLIIGVVCCSFSSVFMAYFFEKFTKAAMPWLDAPITVFSVWATWLVIKKKLQNWLLWIVIDLLAVYLYYKRNLELTALLYLLYTLLAFIGYYQWRKVYQASLK
jgi:nicotinamide mononucleotide transporter